jgi:hypothetical protein
MEKLGMQDTVLGIKQYQRDWLQHVERTGTDRMPNRHRNRGQKGREAQDARGKDGRTIFTLRDKEQALRQTLHSS